MPYNLSPRSHTILLVDKAGKRSIHNFRQVQRHVTERFGGMAKVEVTSYAGLTMVQQLSLVARTTVAVSPCGSISMILPFLPEEPRNPTQLHARPTGLPSTRRVRGLLLGNGLSCGGMCATSRRSTIRCGARATLHAVGRAATRAVKVDVARLEGLVAASLADMQP